ncbi:LexA family protein [Metabacillus litoralis]|uniref:LexA family protein n=1 Tax=Metabacillus litoralis TaxID=152268 RepID=UPI00203ED735|nr:S24 family peptidase [Metabacillus litoralis]MCM3413567.1 hypothetical protein [Metabacillus litoralis]
MFDKDKFAELLDRAKGKRSINVFAKECGIAAAHISRLLRGLVDTAPTPPTIRKFADHSQNEVTYEDLMNAAGHFSGIVHHVKGSGKTSNVMLLLNKYLKNQDSNIKMIIDNGDIELKDIEEIFEVFSADDEFVKIPIIGSVKAGPNGLAYEDFQGYETTDKKSVNGGKYKWLMVTGDSMIDEGILPGDLALLREQSDVEHGELAVVIIDNEEGTMKRVLKIDNGIVLQPANRKYQPEYFFGKDLERIRIVGKIKETKRKY